jgi:hypothetical protein
VEISDSNVYRELLHLVGLFVWKVVLFGKLIDLVPAEKVVCDFFLRVWNFEVYETGSVGP